MPTIVFQVNMAPDVHSYPVPANKTAAVFSAEVAAQRVCWLPNNLRDNRELKDGVQFSTTGAEAIYLRDLVNGGKITFLSIISTTA